MSQPSQKNIPEWQWREPDGGVATAGAELVRVARIRVDRVERHFGGGRLRGARRAAGGIAAEHTAEPEVCSTYIST